MSNLSKHLSPDLLEALEEGELPPQQQAAARDHLLSCAPCAAEWEMSRTVAEALRNLPRFAPSADFGGAVMARVRIAAAPHPFVVWVRRWLPRVRQSWSLVLSLLLAPVIALGMAAGWMFSTGELSGAEVWQWSTERVSDLAWSATGGMVNWIAGSGTAPRAGQMVDWAASVSPAQAFFGVVALMVAVTLSSWALVRLLRTPTGALTHA